MLHYFFSCQQMATHGNITFLPDDIIRNILKRLPVKSLIRFQSVCKDWNNLFKTPLFVADHLHHSDDKNPLLAVNRSRGLPNSYDLYFLNREMEILQVPKTPLIGSSCLQMVGSSNGLLCVSLHDAATGSQHALLLWNPAIREVRYVPKTIYYGVGHEYFGFGFSPIVNGYKTVNLRSDDFYKGFLINCMQVEVYSLSTGPWKEVRRGITEMVRHRYGSITVTANGAIFWLGTKELML